VKLDRWFAAKAAIVITVIAYLFGSWWFTDLLANERPKAPAGAFTVPFKQHDAVTYVTPGEHWAHLALIACGVVLVLAWWLVEHFEKRSRTR
jgi:hypothetical protein